MNINIKTIPHKDQRYDTCGDYWWDSETLQVRISELGRADWEFLILIHELIEWFLIHLGGIDVNDIDRFDREYEANRKKGDISEPGNDPKAPYHTQHMIASAFERLLAPVLGVDWGQYEKFIDSL